jgi:hypothetical protein
MTASGLRPAKFLDKRFHDLVDKKPRHPADGPDQVLQPADSFVLRIVRLIGVVGGLVVADVLIVAEEVRLLFVFPKNALKLVVIAVSFRCVVFVTGAVCGADGGVSIRSST